VRLLVPAILTEADALARMRPRRARGVSRVNKTRRRVLSGAQASALQFTAAISDAEGCAGLRRFA
jgi:hypothetical protein